MSDRKQRILIIDDEESIRRSLQAYLEDDNFEVVAVGQGEEGLEALAHAPIDAAIVDMRLPGMDGNTFIERAHELAPSLTFFIYTGSVGYKPPPDLQAIGISEKHVFRKPLGDMSMLADALRDLIKGEAEDDGTLHTPDH